MKVIINGTTYNDITWQNNGFYMQTDMTLSEIEQVFSPGLTTDIVVIDGTEEVARYYNKGIDSIKVTNTDPRFVEVQFNLTQITQNAETEIRESLDCSDGAIAELADLIAMIADLYQQMLYNFDLRIRALETAAQIVSIEPTEPTEGEE